MRAGSERAPPASMVYSPGARNAEKSSRYVSTHGPNGPAARAGLGPNTVRSRASATRNVAIVRRSSVHTTATFGASGR